MTQSLVGAPTQRTATVVGGVWCARVCACVRACIHACVMCLQYTIILFFPGLIMIITKITFLSFIKIAD